MRLGVDWRSLRGAYSVRGTRALLPVLQTGAWRTRPTRRHVAAQATEQRRLDPRAPHTRRRTAAGRVGVRLRVLRGSAFGTGARARAPAERSRAGRRST